MKQKKKVIVLIILKKTINVKLRVSPTCLILGYEQNQYNECDRFLVFTIPIFQDSFSKFHFFFSKEKYNIFFWWSWLLMISSLLHQIATSTNAFDFLLFVFHETEIICQKYLTDARETDVKFSSFRKKRLKWFYQA